MSYFLSALATEYILVIHRQSKAIVFVRTSPGIDIDLDLIETLQKKLQFNEIELPEAENAIEQSSVEDRYVVLRGGQYTYQVLVITSKPNRFTRETLHGFGIKLENRWAKELKTLYTDLEGNTKVFLEKRSNRLNLPQIVDEVFRLDYTLPHKLGIPRSLKRQEKKVWSSIEELARGKGFLLLDEAIQHATDSLGINVQTVSSIIAGFIGENYIVPIPLDVFMEKYV